MKRSLPILCFCLILVAALQAQDKNETAVTYKKTFVVKIAPAGLGIGKITFGGEYNFKRKSSITLLLGAPFDKSRTITYDDKKSNVTSSAKSALIGYRYYLGKKGRSGFYAEPYAKYVKFNASGLLNADLEGRDASFDSRFDYEGFGAGIQLGAQFFIAKIIAIDLFLIGPEANSSKFSSVSTDVLNNIPWTLANSQDAEQQIKDNLKNIPYLGDKIDVTVNTNTKTVYTKYAGFAPGFRAGASIGIRF